jgi:small conductance mechanosensitive channel
VASRRHVGALSILAFLLLVLLSAGLAPAARAADIPNILPPAAEPAPPSARELDSLIQTIENDKSRGDFLRNLKALRDAQRKVETDEQKATSDNWLARFSSQLRTAVGSVAALGSDIDLRRFAAWAKTAIADPAARRIGLEGLFKILGIIGAGLLTHIIVAYAFTRPRRAIEGRTYTSILSRTLFALLRLILDVLPLVAGAGVALAVAGFIEPRPVTRLIALALVNALVACEALMMVARFILAPRMPNLRVPPLADETAHYLYIWVCRLGYIALYGYFALEAALLMGMSKSAYGVLINVLGLIIALLLIIFILQNRETWSNNIRGATDADGHWVTLRRPLAAVWHLLAIFYVVALYLVLTMRGNDGTIYIVRGTVLTAIVLLLVWGLDNAARSLTRRGFTIAEEIRIRFPGLQTRVNRYTAAITILLRLFIGVLATATILEAWGVEIFAWVASPLGQRIASAAVSIGLIIALALVTWELVSSLIERQLMSKGRVSTRALTLLPLARTALRLVLVVLVTMVVLAEIGMNITPLLAGAGVIGLAVGFGAQKLVQDVITGWFILMEDTISVGDVVDLEGNHSGVVERINIRTIQLRDAEGAVHTMPFSSVTTIKNMTRDFSYYLFNISVAYREDPDQVIAILQSVDEEMRKDPDFSSSILGPLEVDGLDRFGVSEIIIRARTKTRPIQQWRVGREFNRRIKKAFEAEGINIPIPRAVVLSKDVSDLSGLAPEQDDKNKPTTAD